MSVAVGVELNQQRAAICVIQGDHRKDGVHFLVRHLERLPPKLRYTNIAERLSEIFDGIRRGAGSGARSFPVYANESVVGAPALDLIAKACPGINLQRVHFNHGQQAPDYRDYVLTVGKGWLVSHLQVLLQTGRLHLPEISDARVLSDDLFSYQGPPESSGRDTPGSFSVGTQDDLVNALGLAVHREPPRRLTEKERRAMRANLAARAQRNPLARL